MTIQLFPATPIDIDNPDNADLCNPDLSELIQQRFEALCSDEDYDPDIHGLIFLVEPGDGIAQVEIATGCDLISDPFTSVRFGNPAFRPNFELLEEHAFCFEMVFVPGDGEFGIVIIIPKAGIDLDLLAFCQTYAVPAEEAS